MVDGSPELAAEALRIDVDSRQGWKIHALALLVFAALYAVVFWEQWGYEEGYKRLGAIFVGFALALHASVSTMVVAIARRHRKSAAIVVHVLVFCFAAIVVCADLQDDARRGYSSQRSR